MPERETVVEDLVVRQGTVGVAGWETVGTPVLSVAEKIAEVLRFGQKIAEERQVLGWGTAVVQLPGLVEVQKTGQQV